jgi:hypothetical protein
MEHEYYEISRLFPQVEEIRIKVAETNSWPWNRLREFSLGQGSKSNFHMECPMSKCLGPDTGISYESVLSEMVRTGEVHRRVRLTCSGYGGYNLTFHCDWYAVLDISITYLRQQSAAQRHA